MAPGLTAARRWPCVTGRPSTQASRSIASISTLGCRHRTPDGPRPQPRPGAATPASVPDPAPDTAPDSAPAPQKEPLPERKDPSSEHRGDGPSATSPTTSGTPSPSGSKGGPLAIPGRFDANLNLQVGSLGYRGATLSGLYFDGSLANGRLTIRDAGVHSLAGTRVRIEGVLSGLGETPSSEGVASGVASSEGAASSGGMPSFEGTVTASSDNPSGLFQVLRIEPPVAPGKLGPMRLSARTKAIRDGIAVDAKLELAGAKATVAGSVEGLAKTPAFDLRFDGRHPDLLRLAALFGAEIRKDGTHGGPVALELSAKGNPDAVSVEAEATLAKGAVRLAGRIDTPFDAPGLDVSLDLRHPDLVGLVRVFQPGYAPAGTELGGLDLMAGLKGGGDTVLIEEIEGNVGPTNVAGNGSWHTSGPRPRLKLALACGVISLNDYLAPPEAPDPAQRPRTEPGGERTSPAAAGADSVLGQAAGDGPEPSSGSRRWSAEPIDLTTLARADAEIEIRAQALVYGPFHVERPSIDATLEGRVLRIERLAGTLFDGRLNMVGGLDGRGVPAIDVDIAVKGMNVAKALFLADGFDLATGTFDFGAKLSARGRSQARSGWVTRGLCQLQDQERRRQGLRPARGQRAPETSRHLRRLHRHSGRRDERRRHQGFVARRHLCRRKGLHTDRRHETRRRCRGRRGAGGRQSASLEHRRTRRLPADRAQGGATVPRSPDRPPSRSTQTLRFRGAGSLGAGAQRHRTDSRPSSCRSRP